MVRAPHAFPHLCSLFPCKEGIDIICLKKKKKGNKALEKLICLRSAKEHQSPHLNAGLSEHDIQVLS